MGESIWNIVVYSSITFSILSILIVIFNVIKHRKFVERNELRIKNMISNLKPGDEIIFQGSMIGTFIQKEEDTAIVEISEGVRIKVLIYSINTVLT